MDNAAKERSWQVFLGSFILLVASYAIYYFRFQIWNWTSLESIFTVLILSYLAVLMVALILLKTDLKISLSNFFSFHGWNLILIGLGLALLFQVLWYGITIALGTKLAFLSFPSLRGYETYAYFSIPTAFTLYAVFSVFGAFVEEVAYRGYVQTKISAKYGIAIGILVATIFFSLQHIHIFQLPWIVIFFQGQFVNVFALSVIAGYLFFKTRDIWSVFLFHGVCNFFNISLALQITYISPYVYYISTITSYVALFVIIRFLLFRKNKAKFEFI
jgi:membrane protease YdiL (CAAX protease family)